ncbi:hypothetical protein PHISCL_03885 [Aspergillus sclerotialis]|uniref:Uncharacterized protein n=1 Tax=Aspergillus sclerotialis TaxID=2070753 RepID=A0A3A2ZMG6_9EURO|nr:hypothetical protein PHISCL_03885 [Aspergillus sclerotialis]
MLSLHHKALTRLFRRLFQRSSYYRLTPRDTSMSINPRTGGYEEWDIGMWDIDEMEDGSVLDEILGSESGSSSGSEEEDEKRSLSELGYRLSGGDGDGDGEEAKGDGSPDSSETSVSPLAKYFDPSASLLIEEVMEPKSPAVPAWERKLNRRIREGKGLRAWFDWAVDRVVGRVQKATEDR